MDSPELNFVTKITAGLGQIREMPQLHSLSLIFSLPAISIRYIL